MAKLINGDGNTAVYASEDADLIASLAGNVTGIAKLGNQFAYELADANTIEVKDGVIITQEGRRIQLDVNAVDIFEIPNGVQGNTNYYIIGYKLETDAESKQTATTFVQLMDNGTDTIPEGTFRGGDTDVYISLYRVTQDGLSITDVDLLLPVLDNISELKSALPKFVDVTVASQAFSYTFDTLPKYINVYGAYHEGGGTQFGASISGTIKINNGSTDSFLTLATKQDTDTHGNINFIQPSIVDNTVSVSLGSSILNGKQVTLMFA